MHSKILFLKVAIVKCQNERLEADNKKLKDNLEEKQEDFSKLKVEYDQIQQVSIFFSKTRVICLN